MTSESNYVHSTVLLSLGYPYFWLKPMTSQDCADVARLLCTMDVMRGSDTGYSSALITGVSLCTGGLLLAGVCSVAAMMQSGRMTILLMAAAGLFTLVFVAGLVITGITLFLGLRKSVSAGKPVKRFDGVKVIARYAVNGLGETLFDEYFIDPEDKKLKFYVRLNLSGYGTSEYRCNPLVWGQCGEAMIGTAMIQGEWVGQFVRSIGAGVGNPHEREAPRR